jgi:hypothetical protein
MITSGRLILAKNRFAGIKNPCSNLENSCLDAQRPLANVLVRLQTKNVFPMKVQNAESRMSTHNVLLCNYGRLAAVI